MNTLKITEATSDQKLQSEVAKIRRHFDKKAGVWYFSVADVIAATTKSSDPRNYWKVLKNRLKNTNYELVTKCNQLKMLSKDGKSYLTDTADLNVLREILKALPGNTLDRGNALLKILESISSQNSEKVPILEQTSTHRHVKKLMRDIRPKHLSIKIKCDCGKAHS